MFVLCSVFTLKNKVYDNPVDVTSYINQAQIVDNYVMLSSLVPSKINSTLR